MSKTKQAPIGGIGPSGYDVKRELLKRAEQERRATMRKLKRSW